MDRKWALCCVVLKKAWSCHFFVYSHTLKSQLLIFVFFIKRFHNNSDINHPDLFFLLSVPVTMSRRRLFTCCGTAKVRECCVYNIWQVWPDNEVDELQ